MEISSRSKNTYSIGLERDHVGVQGRTLFLVKKQRRSGLPESLREEPEIRSLAAKGWIVLSAPAQIGAREEEKKRGKKSRENSEG